jgi:glucan phosphoethanolaminetransferase (alkaline phosphatase superfamily)
VRDAWRRWLPALALDLHLLMPLVVERIAFRGGESLRVFAFSLTASILWLTLLHGVFRRPAIMHAVLLPFHLVAAAELFGIIHYRTSLSSSVLSVLLENTGSTGDFLVAHAGAIAVVLVPAGALYAFCIHRLRRASRPRRLRLSAIAGAGLGVLYGTGFGVAYGDVGRLAAADRSAPFGVVSQGWLAWQVYRDAEAEDTRAFRFHARRTEAVDLPETYVLVIGESARRDHFGLYGYERPTTPLLSQQSNWIVFRDAVTQAPYTSASVPLLLTRGSVEDPERARGERSIVALFGELGFDTHWLSTQQREPYAVAINRCSRDAAEQVFAENQYDGALVGMLSRALASGGSKRFIVIHTMGNHFPYASRRPPSYARFVATDATWRAALVRDYDDSVLYTDYVLSELVRTLSATRGYKALLYVADHGENLRDDDRNLVGHYMSNEYDLPIPMMLWYSSELAERWPEKIAGAKRSAAMRVSTRSVFYTLADLAGATFDDPSIDTLSLLRPGFRETTRFVKRGEGTADYDAWRSAR